MSRSWPALPLGALAERMTSKNAEGNSNVLTISARHGLVSQRDYFNKTVASDNLSNYYLLTNGDFAYNKSYSDGYPVGAIKRLDRYASGVVSPLYICFRLTAIDQVVSNFLVYFFESGLLDGAIRAIAKEGARNHGLLNVKVSEFFELPITLPPIGEQRKIAAILSAVDDAIEATQAVIDQLQVVKKAMMAELLTRGLPGRHTRFKQADIGEVPDSWEVARLGELLQDEAGICYGVVQPGDHTEGGVPLIRVNNVHEGRVDLSDLKRIAKPISDSYQRSMLRGGELLVTIVGTIGRCAVAPAEAAGMNLARAVAKVELGDRTNAAFIGAVLESEYGQRALAGETRESARKTLNLEQLRNVPLALPPRWEQDEIVAAVSAFRERDRSERLASAALRSVKTAVMSALLSGSLRVTPDEAAA